MMRRHDEDDLQAASPRTHGTDSQEHGVARMNDRTIIKIHGWLNAVTHDSDDSWDALAQAWLTMDRSRTVAEQVKYLYESAKLFHFTEMRKRARIATDTAEPIRDPDRLAIYTAAHVAELNALMLTGIRKPGIEAIRKCLSRAGYRKSTSLAYEFSNSINNLKLSIAI